MSFRKARRFLPLLIGAGLFGLGLFALYHLLRPVNPQDIFAQIRATPVPRLLGALAATALGYLALVFYDWYALRYIGRRLPPGVVGLGGFLGSAFGNTIGVSVVSGGAVRYRIYSAVGLNAFEVAAVSSYVAAALGTGLILVGLAALAFNPAAIAGHVAYAPETIRTASLLAVTVATAAILWGAVTQRSLRLWRIELRMPPVPHVAGQVVVTLVDIAAAAFALWILLPAGKPDYASFVAIFACATVVGVASHVPGGIGVFETVVLGALPAAVPAGDAAAALLLFRLIYYLVPFALGFLLVAANEARLAGSFGGRVLARIPAAVQPALGTLHGFAPGLVAVVAFGFGAYLLLVTMIPSVRSDAIADVDLVGALLLEGGTLASAIAGVLLLILSHGLALRVGSAYWLAVIALAAAAVASLLNDLDLANSLLLSGGALALLPFRRAFDRAGRLTTGVFEPQWFAMVAGVTLATAALFFFLHKAVPYSNDLWSEFRAGSNTPRALRAGLAASAVLVFFGIYLLVRPMRRMPAEEMDPGALARAAALAAVSDNPQAWLSQTGDKWLLFSESGRSFLMYGVRGRSFVALGDPVGDPSEVQALCWSFSEMATRANCRPVFYEVGAANLSLWVDLGFTLNKIGEEAVIPLREFGLAGGRFKTMRAALNKRQREGYELEALGPPHDRALIDRLREVSDAWLSGKTGREKGFSVGRFDSAYLDHFEIAVVRKEGRVVAFANLLATSEARFVAVDLMRYLPEEASGLIEYMFLRLMEIYRERGTEEFSLGMAPLAGLSEHSVGRSWNRFGRLIYRHGGAFYNFEGLRAFKQKFQPEWRPHYLALPPGVSPLIALGDVALLIAGTPRGLLGD